MNNNSQEKANYYYLTQRISELKRQLRIKEHERNKLWKGLFWLWILIPIILICFIVFKFGKQSKLDGDIDYLRNQIRDLEEK